MPGLPAVRSLDLRDEEAGEVTASLATAAPTPRIGNARSGRRVSLSRVRYIARVSDRAPSLELAERVPGLAPWPAGLAADVDAQAAVIRRGAGDVLFDEGSPCSGMLVLGSGLVRVSRAAPDGRELLLYRVRPGETCVLTLSCLLGHASYPARGIAESDVAGVFLPAPLFERLTSVSAAFREFVFDAFSTRLRGMLELASSVAFDRLDRRLASALLARVDAEGRIELAVTHQHLADELASGREPVSRLLESFQLAGLVELGRGRVRVLDKAGLAARASAGA